MGWMHLAGCSLAIPWCWGLWEPCKLFQWDLGQRPRCQGISYNPAAQRGLFPEILACLSPCRILRWCWKSAAVGGYLSQPSLKLAWAPAASQILGLVIVWSSHKWTRTGSGSSEIWIWSKGTESGTRYTPALDCYLLTFWHWKRCINALTVRQREIFTLYKQ